MYQKSCSLRKKADQTSNFFPTIATLRNSRPVITNEGNPGMELATFVTLLNL